MKECRENPSHEPCDDKHNGSNKPSHNKLSNTKCSEGNRGGVDNRIGDNIGRNNKTNDDKESSVNKHNTIHVDTKCNAGKCGIINIKLRLVYKYLRPENFATFQIILMGW